MRKILIGLDFSGLSEHLLRFGFEWADALQSEVGLLHVFPVPIVSADAFVYVPAPEDLEKMKENFVSQLHELGNKVLGNLKLNVHFTAHAINGSPADSILDFARESNFDLILLGLQGANYVSERLIGSTTTHLFHNSFLPVLAIHKSCQFTQINNVLFAYDQESFHNKALLGPLLSLKEKLQFSIQVLSIVNEMNEFPSLAQKMEADQLEPFFPIEGTSYHIIQNEDPAAGIQEYCKNNSIDLLTLVPRKHSFFESLFKESTSKKIAYHTELPILALPD